MCRHLCTLVKTTKGLGGKGKLTGKLIDELTIFYGLAIRRNSSSYEDMKREMWATLYHKILTNENPQHSKYTELSRDDLLRRCLGGFAQNSNESFNSTLWQIASKIVHSGKKVLPLTIGPACYNFCLEANAKRVNRAEDRLTDDAKMARRAIVAARKQDDYLDYNVKGLLYGTGIAD